MLADPGPQTQMPSSLAQGAGPCWLRYSNARGRDVLPGNTLASREAWGPAGQPLPRSPQMCTEADAALSPGPDLSTPEPQLATVVQLQTSSHVCFLFRAHLWVERFDAGHLQRLREAGSMLPLTNVVVW